MKRFLFELTIAGEHYLLEGQGADVSEAFEDALNEYEEPLDPVGIEGEVIFEPARDDDGEELPPIVDWFTPGEC